MVKPAYLFAAFLMMLVFIAGLVAFVVVPDNGPFNDHYSSGAGKSLVSVK